MFSVRVINEALISTFLDFSQVKLSEYNNSAFIVTSFIDINYISLTCFQSLTISTLNCPLYSSLSKSSLDLIATAWGAFHLELSFHFFPRLGFFSTSFCPWFFISGWFALSLRSVFFFSFMVSFLFPFGYLFGSF